MEHLARMRTLDAAYEMLKAEDPDTAISKYYLRYLMLSGQIPVHRVGCKRLLNYDALLVFLEFRKMVTITRCTRQQKRH